MSNVIPPVPYRVPIQSKSGELHPLWAAWFRELFTRVGGTGADSNLTLTTAITTMQTTVDQVNTDVNALNALYAEVTALGQGRDLRV